MDEIFWNRGFCIHLIAPRETYNLEEGWLNPKKSLEFYDSIICGVQILFRQSTSSDGMVKLTNEDIKWLVMRVNSGFFTVKKAAQVYGVTERRVQHFIKKHRDTGKNPRLSPNRRPKTSLSADQKAVSKKPTSLHYLKDNL